MGPPCGPRPFERDVDGGHVLFEECSKGGRDIEIVGYECKEGVGVVLIGGSGGKPGGNKKLSPRRIPTVGIVRKVPSTPYTTPLLRRGIFGYARSDAGEG